MAQRAGAAPSSAPSASSSSSASSAPAPEQKKGEVNELRTLLRAVNAERNADASNTRKKREVIKKCIAYMTLGIDVSRLFPDMIMACNTRGGAAGASQDLVIKKMVYLYLTNYAQSNSELTLLVINTLQKDCESRAPRGVGVAPEPRWCGAGVRRCAAQAFLAPRWRGAPLAKLRHQRPRAYCSFPPSRPRQAATRTR